MGSQDHRQEVQEAIRRTLPEFCERNKLIVSDETLDNLASWVAGTVPAGLVRVGCGSDDPDLEIACACTGLCQRWVRAEDWLSLTRPDRVKLQIKRRDGGEGLTGHDYEFLMNGQPIGGLMSLKLQMGVQINTCEIKFMPDDVEVDADAMAALSVALNAETDDEEDDKIVHLPQLIASQIGCSTSEARRILNQGGIRKNGEVVKDLDLPESEVAGADFQVGGRRSFSVPSFSLFILTESAKEGEIVTWGRETLPIMNRHVDGLELVDNKVLLKFRLTAGLPDLLRLHLEAMDEVEEFEIKRGDVALVQPGPREEP